MFYYVRQIWNSQPVAILISMSSKFLNRTLGMMQLLFGTQIGNLPKNPVNENSFPTRAEGQAISTIYDSATTATSEIIELDDYCPPIDEIVGYGSTSVVGRVRPGVVLKYPRYSWRDPPSNLVHKFVQDIKQSFDVEAQILGILGPHANIINFLGSSEDPIGLLFTEANLGNLQEYLDLRNDIIDEPLRSKWRIQATEAVRYLHLKGVIHSDLRPANFLLHTDLGHTPDLYLSDFGGSTCGDIDGRHLPDSGFFDPRKPWVSTYDTDIFSLGSIFYTIMTGHWPFNLPGPFISCEDKETYDEKVDRLFSQGKFPTVESLAGGVIIHGCWTGKYKDVGAMQVDQRLMLKEDLI